MVSKARGIGAGIFITLGSSVMMGGFVLLGHAMIMDSNNNGISTRESATIAVSAVMVILFGVGIAAFSKILLEETEKEKEDRRVREDQKAKEAQQPVKRGFRSSKFTKDEGYKVSI